MTIEVLKGAKKMGVDIHMFVLKQTETGVELIKEIPYIGRNSAFFQYLSEHANEPTESVSKLIELGEYEYGLQQMPMRRLKKLRKDLKKAIKNCAKDEDGYYIDDPDELEDYRWWLKHIHNFMIYILTEHKDYGLPTESDIDSAIFAFKFDR